MNNEKLTLANIAAYLAQQKGITKKVAISFLQQLTETLGEELLRDGEVKVKGLGLFKIEWHESRMSVNVQTGKKYEIAGHNKITFTPDKSMREVVNKPFEHLEPIVMDNEPISANDTWMDDEELRLKRFSEQAQEILGIIADLQQIQPEDKNQTSQTIETPTVSPTDPVAHIQQNVSIDKQEIEQASTSTTTNIADSAKTIVQKKSVEKDSIPACSDEKIMMERMAKQVPISNKRWVALSILFAVVVVISIPIYYYFFVMNHGDDATQTTTVLASTSSTHIKTIAAIPVIHSKPTATKVSTQPTLTSNPLTQSRTYKETIATETFKEGSRLTLMALKYYGNKLFWVYIYEANKDKIANPDCISAGTHIKIPKLNPKLIDVHNPQCLIQASALQTTYTKRHAIQAK